MVRRLQSAGTAIRVMTLGGQLGAAVAAAALLAVWLVPFSGSSAAAEMPRAEVSRLLHALPTRVLQLPAAASFDRCCLPPAAGCAGIPPWCADQVSKMQLGREHPVKEFQPQR